MNPSREIAALSSRRSSSSQQCATDFYSRERESLDPGLVAEAEFYCKQFYSFLDTHTLSLFLSRECGPWAGSGSWVSLTADLLHAVL
jgi:hypothetical protein